MRLLTLQRLPRRLTGPALSSGSRPLALLVSCLVFFFYLTSLEMLGFYPILMGYSPPFFFFFFFLFIMHVIRSAHWGRVLRPSGVGLHGHYCSLLYRAYVVLHLPAL
jgi:hypothetical protein